jgi:hypothetical protein
MKKNFDKQNSKVGDKKYLAFLQEMSNMFLPTIWKNQVVNHILHIWAHPNFFYISTTLSQFVWHSHLWHHFIAFCQT